MAVGRELGERRGHAGSRRKLRWLVRRRMSVDRPEWRFGDEAWWSSGLMQRVNQPKWRLARNLGGGVWFGWIGADLGTMCRTWCDPILIGCCWDGQTGMGIARRIWQCGEGWAWMAAFSLSASFGLGWARTLLGPIGAGFTMFNLCWLCYFCCGTLGGLWPVISPLGRRGCTLSAISALRRQRVHCLIIWSRPSYGRVKPSHNGKADVQSLLWLSLSLSFPLCRHVLCKANRVACDALFANRFLRECIVCVGSSIVDRCSYTMGLRLNVPSLYSAVSLIVTA